MRFIIWQKLRRWIKRRHPNKTLKWCMEKYFHTMGTSNYRFSTKEGLTLASHADTPIKRHVRVREMASPFNGDWTYWSI